DRKSSAEAVSGRVLQMNFMSWPERREPPFRLGGVMRNQLSASVRYRHSRYPFSEICPFRGLISLFAVYGLYSLCRISFAAHWNVGSMMRRLGFMTSGLPRSSFSWVQWSSPAWNAVELKSTSVVGLFACAGPPSSRV